MGDDISNASVAQRMSWASRRSTSKPEDIPYCLLGIFDLNMSLLYGEGSLKAFRRLQELIIRDSDDQSIFAWARQQVTPPFTQDQSTLLATAPSEYHAFGTIVDADPPEVEGYMLGIRTATEFGNKGMQITPPLIQTSGSGALAVLACTYENLPDSRIVLYLEDSSTNGGRYMRGHTYIVRPITTDQILSCATFKRFFIVRRT